MPPGERTRMAFSIHRRTNRRQSAKIADRTHAFSCIGAYYALLPAFLLIVFSF